MADGGGGAAGWGAQGRAGARLRISEKCRARAGKCSGRARAGGVRAFGGRPPHPHPPWWASVTSEARTRGAWVAWARGGAVKGRRAGARVRVWQSRRVLRRTPSSCASPRTRRTWLRRRQRMPPRRRGRPTGGRWAARRRRRCVRPRRFVFRLLGRARSAAAPPRRSLAFLSGAARGHARARHHVARPCVKARVARGRGMLLPRTFAVCSTAAKALRVQRVWAPPAAQRHHDVSLSHDHADSPDRVSHRVLNRRMLSTLRAALPFFGKQAASRTGGAHGVVRRRAAAAGCRNEGTQGVRSGVKGCSRAAGAGGRRGRCEGKGGGGQCEAGGRGGATR